MQNCLVPIPVLLLISSYLFCLCLKLVNFLQKEILAWLRYRSAVSDLQSISTSSWIQWEFEAQNSLLNCTLTSVLCFTALGVWTLSWTHELSPWHWRLQEWRSSMSHNISQHVIESMELGSILMRTKPHLLYAVNLVILIAITTVMERPTSEYIRWT